MHGDVGYSLGPCTASKQRAVANRLNCGCRFVQQRALKWCHRSMPSQEVRLLGPPHAHPAPTRNSDWVHSGWRDKNSGRWAYIRISTCASRHPLNKGVLERSADIKTTAVHMQWCVGALGARITRPYIACSSACALIARLLQYTMWGPRHADKPEPGTYAC